MKYDMPTEYYSALKSKNLKNLKKLAIYKPNSLKYHQPKAKKYNSTLYLEIKSKCNQIQRKKELWIPGISRQWDQGVFVVFKTGSYLLCSLGWCGTHCVEQALPELTKTCATMLSFIHILKNG